MRSTCGSCRWFDPVAYEPSDQETNPGVCRRNAPRPAWPSSAVGTYASTWPPVEGLSDWCAEHARTEPPPTLTEIIDAMQPPPREAPPLAGLAGPEPARRPWWHR